MTPTRSLAALRGKGSGGIPHCGGAGVRSHTLRYPRPPASQSSPLPRPRATGPQAPRGAARRACGGAGVLGCMVTVAPARRGAALRGDRVHVGQGCGGAGAWWGGEKGTRCARGTGRV